MDPRIRENDFELLAVAAIYLVRRLSKMQDCLVSTKFEESEVKECALKLLMLFQLQEEDQSALKKKYASDKYHRASLVSISN